MDWQHNIFAKNDDAGTARVRLVAADRPEAGPPIETLDATVVIQWREHRTDEAIREVALARLQTLIRLEIARLAGYPPDAVS